MTLAFEDEPAAETRPTLGERLALDERLGDLNRRGALLPAREPGRPLRAAARRPGVLARFLAERGH